MECVKFFIFLFLMFLLKYSINSDDSSDERSPESPVIENILSDTELNKKPSVTIVSLVRNKAHTLPLFLSYLEGLDYPKERISLWLVTDHNEDNSQEILEVWLKRVQNMYHSVHYQFNDSEKLRKGESNMTHWPEERFRDLIQMKEEALNHARNSWSDFIFFLDADVFLTAPNTLDMLISFNKAVIAPLLSSDTLYSNFWCGMSPDYYYQRTDDYKKIRNYDMLGEFAVPMVHSAVLIDLRRVSSDYLTFNASKLNNLYDGPIDDIIIFAISAKLAGIEMTISNSMFYGYIMIPLDQEEKLEKDFHQLVNIKILIINYYNEVKVVPELEKFVVFPEKSKYSFSEVFMINLKRRPERRHKMERILKELGIDYTLFEAIDGKLLNHEILAKRGIKFLPVYEDPYHKRPMKMGEVGCFLSHYAIWQKMVNENLMEVLILEDDIRFEPYFRVRALELMAEARSIGGYDMIYFGRKRLQSDEEFIDKSENFVKTSYTYWTLGYAITLEGAKKLLAADPMNKLIPVDEFLPIMFDQHPNDTWKSNYPNRNLKAWSVNPLLLYPTHYTGEDGYISDTEDSVQIGSDLLALASEFNQKNVKENILHHSQHASRDASEL